MCRRNVKTPGGCKVEWMIADGLWQPEARKATHRQWRPRKASFGEMVQTATSEHDWFEGQGERAVLIALIDDATSRVTMRLFDADTALANMTPLRDYITLYGAPWPSTVTGPAVPWSTARPAWRSSPKPRSRRSGDGCNATIASPGEHRHLTPPAAPAAALPGCCRGCRWCRGVV